MPVAWKRWNLTFRRRWKGADRCSLLPMSAEAREVLPEQLTKMGAVVDVVEAYRTVRPDREKNDLVDMFEKGEIDMVTFTSSSTVKNFMEMFEDQGELFKKGLKGVAVACIGPITARTAEEKGLSVSLFPSEYTIEALTGEIVTFFSTPQPRR